MSGESKKIGVAVMAGGGRARGVVQNLLRDSGGNVEVRSVFDPDKEVAKHAVEYWKTPNALICDSVEEAVRSPGVDWVMVFSPNAFHKEQILVGFAAGRNVFSEKPLATTMEDCQAIYDAHQKSGCLFATGFVLRYSPIYKQAKEILDSGKLGRILSIDANENIGPEHGGYIMTNWRRFTRFSGPHILEKCCHDLDMLNFFTESVPSRIAAFGGLDFFVPENQKMMDKYGNKTFMS